MDANVATTDLRIETSHVDSQNSLTNRLGHLAERVPPPMIADVSVSYTHLTLPTILLV